MPTARWAAKCRRPRPGPLPTLLSRGPRWRIRTTDRQNPPPGPFRPRALKHTLQAENEPWEDKSEKSETLGATPALNIRRTSTGRVCPPVAATGCHASAEGAADRTSESSVPVRWGTPPSSRGITAPGSPRDRAHDGSCVLHLGVGNERAAPVTRGRGPSVRARRSSAPREAPG
jgi:hypothetical protein